MEEYQLVDIFAFKRPLVPFLAFCLFLRFLSEVADFTLTLGQPIAAASKATNGSLVRHNCNKDLAACQFAWISCRHRSTFAS